MTHAEVAHLKLLAEIDALVERLKRWTERAPHWQPAESTRALVRRLTDRAASLRVRLEAPLVVATLGGTGTGKSALVNALLGAEIVRTGRQRPTTTRPALICRPGLQPEMLGIEPADVELIQRDLPALADLVLIDAPDPDTTESTESPATNLARLRQILPRCDVLLVATTQQKYRSARVADELAAAAGGARLVFVQTHADLEEDIREDWRKVLAEQYRTGHVFLVDSLAALADAQAGRPVQGEFARLLDLLTQELAGAAAGRIRRANFLDLVEETLAGCRCQIEQAMPPVEKARDAIDQQRSQLAAHLASQMRAELLGSRRQWEHRLLGRIASRWGLSPFALVLRVFHGVGGLLASALLWRARTPAQMALWGMVEGARSWQKRRQQQRAEEGGDRAVAACWDQAELRRGALILQGYAAEAGLDPEAVTMETVAAEAQRAGSRFVDTVAVELESLISRLAQRHTGWFTRWRYELMLAAMLGLLLYRLGKNFFYDSWLAPGDGGQTAPYGLDFYVSAGFWLLLWCLVLLWLLTGRLRRGLRREIDRLADGWKNSPAAAEIFGRLENDVCRVGQFARELSQLEEHVARLSRQLAMPDEELGYRRR